MRGKFFFVSFFPPMISMKNLYLANYIILIGNEKKYVTHTTSLFDFGFINFFFFCTWGYLSVRIQVPKEQNKNMAKQGKLDHRHFLLSNSWTENLLGNLLGKVQKALALWKIHRDIIGLRLTDTSFPPCYAQIELYTWNLIIVGSAKTTIEEGKIQ